MEIRDIPFEVFNLFDAIPEEHKGTHGSAIWKTVQKGGIRVRLVDYTPGYLADHWCGKGHVVYVLEGSFESELKDGRTYKLTRGMCYLVSDETDYHRSFTEQGVTLLIVD